MPFAKNNPFGIRGGNRQANTQAKPANAKNNNSSFHSFREGGCPGESQTACRGTSHSFLGRIRRAQADRVSTRGFGGVLNA